ncbi:MAG: 16S rRNA (guanine(966)-N(2))-methyltransferase RsmD [Acidimicrobiales bacterium]
MRVIAGDARGRKLRVPRLEQLRPTSGRAREAIFDILDSRLLVEGARLLDLFAGSGALGIEALSRGAAGAVFVESDRLAVRAITENLQSLGYLGNEGVEVVRADVLSFLSGPRSRSCDVALIDPPYAFSGWPELLSKLDATTAVLEHSRPIEVVAPYEVVRVYRFGTTLVTLATSGAASTPQVPEMKDETSTDWSSA